MTRWLLFAPLALAFVAVSVASYADDGERTLRGRIRLPDGSPAAGAGVRVSNAAVGPHHVDGARAEARTAVADADGRVEVSVPWPAVVLVRIDSDRAETAEIPYFSLDDRRPFFDVTLEPGRTIAGRVETLAADGDVSLPIGGASVAACAEVERRYAEPRCRTTVTDGDGRFLLRHVAAEGTQLHAWADGRATAVFAAPQNGDEAVLALAPGRPLVGTVVDGDGAPVAGVRIATAPADEDAWPHREVDLVGLDWPTVSDAEGRFEHPGLRPATYSLRALATRDSGPADPVEVALGLVGDDRAHDVELTVPRRPIVAFSLVDANGTAADEVPAVLVQRPAGDPAQRPTAVWVEKERITLDAGRVTATTPLEGRAIVVVRASDALDVVVTDVELKNGSISDLGELALDPGVTVAGRVVDPDDAPVPDATVTVAHADETTGASERRATTDRAGRFVVGGLPEDREAHLFAGADGYRDAEPRAVFTGASDLMVVLEPTGRVVGRVVETGGAPVTAFEVRLHREATGVPDDRGSTFGPAFVQTRTDPDGVFDEQVDPGTYTVEIDADGLAPARVAGVELLAGVPVDLGEIVLDEGLVVVGRVTSDDGSPLEGTVVESGSAGPAFGFGRAGLSAGALTGEDGGYRLAGLLPGVLRVAFRQDGYAPEMREIELVDDGRVREVDVVLGRGGAVEGHFVDAAGSPVTGGGVALTDGMGGTFTKVARTDGFGEFRIEAVPSGSYEIYCVEDTEDPTSRIHGTVTVEADRTTRHDCVPDETGILVSGRVTLGDRPYSEQMFVLLAADADITDLQRSGYRTAMTDADGRYEVRVKRPGTHVATFPAGGSARSKRVVVPDGVEAATIDIDLGGGTLSGTVRKRDGGDLEGVLVSAAVADADVPGALGMALGASAPVARDGSFALDGLAAGDYRVTAHAPGYRVETPPVVRVDENPVSGVDVELVRADRVRVRVEAPDGTPAGGALVLLQDPARPLGGASSGETTDINGRAWIAAPVAGPLRLSVIHPSGALTTVRDVRPQTSEREPDLTVRLARGGTLEVVVLDASGEPVAGRTVALAPRVEDPTFQIRAMFEPTPVTGSAGSATLRRVPTGEYVVRVDNVAVPASVIEDRVARVEVRLPDPR